MALSETSRLAIVGVEAYKQGLLDNFPVNSRAIEIDEIRHTLEKTGVSSSTKVVMIPNEQPALEHAAALKSVHPWADPYTTNMIDRLSRARINHGQALPAEAAANAPLKQFWSSLLDVVVIIDDTAQNNEEFGQTAARGMAVDTIAQALTHSAFAPISRTYYEKNKGQRIIVRQSMGIAQATNTRLLEPYNSITTPHDPTWIDEAFASHMGAEARTALCPESIAQQPLVLSLPQYGVNKIDVPQKYLLSANQNLKPSLTRSGLAGIGLDLLVSKKPNLIDAIKELPAKDVTATVFHKFLRNQLGIMLYENITQHRPTSEWGNILEQIKQL